MGPTADLPDDADWVSATELAPVRESSIEANGCFSVDLGASLGVAVGDALPPLPENPNVGILGPQPGETTRCPAPRRLREPSLRNSAN